MNPFSPEYETYGDRSGMDVIAARLKSESLRSRFHAVVELPDGKIEPGIEQHAADAVRRYCRMKLADVDRDLREVTRHGIRVLLVGLVAVLVLNAVARPLEQAATRSWSCLPKGCRSPPG